MPRVNEEAGGLRSGVMEGSHPEKGTEADGEQEDGRAERGDPAGEKMGAVGGVRLWAETPWRCGRRDRGCGQSPSAS